MLAFRKCTFFIIISALCSCNNTDKSTEAAVNTALSKDSAWIGDSAQSSTPVRKVEPDIVDTFDWSGRYEPDIPEEEMWVKHEGSGLTLPYEARIKINKLHKLDKTYLVEYESTGIQLWDKWAGTARVDKVNELNIYIDSVIEGFREIEASSRKQPLMTFTNKKGNVTMLLNKADDWKGWERTNAVYNHKTHDWEYK